MKLSALADRAYGGPATPAGMWVPVQALGKIYPHFGSRFKTVESTVEPSATYPGEMIELGIGAYFDCDPRIVAAAVASLQSGLTRYHTSTALKTLIARKIADEYAVDIAPDKQVMVMGGARPGIILSLLAGVDPGDRVLIPDPDYIGLMQAACAIGAEVVRVPMLRSSHGRLAPDLDRFEDLAREGVKAILITNPNNPTGHVWSREELGVLSGIAEQHGAFVAVNEVYDRLVFTGKSHTTYLSVGNPENAIVFGGPAKIYEMTGFGVGWIISSAHNIATFEDLLFLTHQSRASNAAQYAAAAALTPPVREEAAEKARVRLLENAHTTVRALDGVHGCRCALPAAGQFAFPWVGVDDIELTQFLKARFGLQIVPGSVWGSQGHGHLRIALANEPVVQAEGLARLVAGFAAFPKKRNPNT